MAILPVEFHPEAVEEAVAARVWYAERSPTAATAFIAEIDNAVQRIQDSPNRWPQDHRGLRRYLLHRFPFMIVYRMTEHTIQIVAVAHARRRPRYWLSRV